MGGCSSFLPTRRCMRQDFISRPPKGRPMESVALCAFGHCGSSSKISPRRRGHIKAHTYICTDNAAHGCPLPLSL